MVREHDELTAQITSVQQQQNTPPSDPEAARRTSLDTPGFGDEAAGTDDALTVAGKDTETDIPGFGDDAAVETNTAAAATGVRPPRRLSLEVEEGIRRAETNASMNAMSSFMPLDEVDSDDDDETSGGYSFGNPDPASDDDEGSTAGLAAVAVKEINGVPVGCTPDPAWLHGELLQKQADQLLTLRGATKGAFLVRALQIKTDKDAPLALSVIVAGKPKHHKITVAPDGGLCVGKFAPMPRPGGSKNLADLVGFLSLAMIGGHSDECAEKAPKWPVRLTTGVNASGQRLPELWTKPVGAANADKPGKDLKVTWVDEEAAETEDRAFLDISVIPRHVAYGRYGNLATSTLFLDPFSRGGFQIALCHAHAAIRIHARAWY